MANHKSAVKSYKQSLVRCGKNKSVKSRVKTFITKVEASLLAKDFTSAVSAFSIAQSEIMHAVSKGSLHINTASRKVSRLAKRVKALEV